MIENARKFVEECAKHSIYDPQIEALNVSEWEEILNLFKSDAQRLNIDVVFSQVKYFPGLLAVFYYRIATFLYHLDREHLAKDFSYLGYSLSGCEIYYSAKIGTGLKINHGMGTVISANVSMGDNITLHHNVGMGRKESNGKSPKIGNNVVIYPHTSIAGDITIGDNAVIGANNFVTEDVPPGKVIKRGTLT